MNIRSFIPPIIAGSVDKILGYSQGKGKYQIGKYKIVTPPNYALSKMQYKHKLYDRFLSVLVNHLTPNKLIIDVGANIGDTAITILQYCQNPIICIEPSELYFSYLKENVNNLCQDDYNRLSLFKKLVGTGSLSGALVHHAGGTASIDIAENSKEITHVRLDDLIDESFNVALLKVDTDGFDYDVIKSAERILSDSRPILFWENYMADDMQYKGFNELYLLLTKKEYRYIYIFDNFGNLITEEHNFETLKNINSYIYSMDKHGCTRTLYYTDILAATEENSLIVKNAINKYRTEYIKNI